MKIIRSQEDPILILHEKKFKGVYIKKSASHPENDIFLFTNQDDNDKEKRLNFFNLFKNYKINVIPPKVQFCIIPILLSDPKPKPLDRIPFPFDIITIGHDNENNFFVRFSTYKDEIPNQKWASDFYFRNLKDLKVEKHIKIFESGEKIYSEIYIQFSFPKEGTVEAAVDTAISEFKVLINRVEAKLRGLSDLFDAVEIWHQNVANKNEKFWQHMLAKHSLILSQCFNSPLILFQKEAFLGGKSIENSHGRLIDFILQNKLTKNLSLIEVKTPKTRIIGKKYRSTYSINGEISGAICQLLDYREQLFKDFYSIKTNSKSDFTIFNPKLLLIVGSLKNMSLEEKKAFELFRLDLKSVEIITFDELFEKVFMQIELLNS